MESVAVPVEVQLSPPSGAQADGPCSRSLYRIVNTAGFFGLLTFLTTGLAATIDIVVLGLVLILIVRGKPFQQRAEAIQFAVVIGFFILFDAWYQGTPGIIAVCHFCALVMLCQGATARLPREAGRVLLLGGMLVLASAAMNVNFLFPLPLVPFCVFLILSLQSLARCDGVPMVFLARRVSVAGYSGTWRVFAIGFLLLSVLWVGFFYLLPRPDVFGIAPDIARRQLLGFSNIMQLDADNDILDNPTVVMRIRPVFDHIIPFSHQVRLRQIRLRGMTFLHYRGGAWKREDYQRLLLRARYIPCQMQYRGLLLQEVTRPIYDLEILLENTDSPMLFLPDQVVDFHLPMPFLNLYEDGAISFPGGRFGVKTYVVRIQLDEPEFPEMSIEEFLGLMPEQIAPFLDTGDAPPAIGRMAADIVRTAPQTIFGYLAAIRLHLHRSCAYSLDSWPHAGPHRDPVERFLFEQQRGSCEHFASAMVLMLRFLGIPARPVTGYQIGDWNSSGQFFTVRQRHAHAWVEVFIPGSGWLPFDPTPSEAHAPDLARGLVRGIGYIREWFEGAWFNYVYRFNRTIQAHGFRRISLTFSRALEYVWDVMRHGFGFGILLGFALAGVWLFFRFRGRKRYLVIAGKKRWIPLWYETWAQSRGHSREVWETPGDFHGRLMREGEIPSTESAAFKSLTRNLNELAFGSGTLDREAAVRREFQDLSARIRAKK